MTGVRDRLAIAAIAIAATHACAADEDRGATEMRAAETAEGGEPAGSGDFRQGPTLFSIIACADIIAYAEVAALSDDEFEARIDKLLRGDRDLDAVIAARGAYDATEPRWAPYAVGQRVALFLRRAGGGHYSVCGQSGEGEFPLDDAHVYLTGHFVEGLDVRRYDLADGVVASQRIERRVFEDAITGVATCPAAAGQAAPRACAPTEPAAYARRSPLHAALAQQAAAQQ